ncbi:MAG: flagellar biosynthesis protein FlgD [Pirellulales bacterium]|nr:flagellar biosynthesis protein FlgD [Pirellulales bacterium]
MSQIGQAASSEFTAREAASQFGGANDAFGEVDIDSFLTLLISELQNQDPLNPVDNSEMLQQIGQIREIGATDQLTQTLSNLSASQELVTASGLIGRQINGLADNGTAIEGVVDRITVETSEENNSRSVKVHVGEQTIDIRNIREIQTG